MLLERMRQRAAAVTQLSASNIGELAKPVIRCRNKYADNVITDIALSWGFNNLSHFSRVFRERTGCMRVTGKS